MADLDKICNDTKAWTRYGSEEGDICVYRRCPECGRYVTHGKLLTNIEGDVKLIGWICKTHGEVEPFYLWD